MDILSLGGFIVGILGFGFGILVSLRGRHLSRPSLKLSIGLIPTDISMPRKLRGKNKRSFIFGAEPYDDGQVVLPCPLRLENPTQLPITDLTLQLEYPLAFLIDNSAFTKRTSQETLIVKTLKAKERTVVRLNDVAQLRYDIPILRPGEKIIFTEPLKMFRFNPPDNKKIKSSDVDSIHLIRRFSGIKEFCNGCSIRVSVWSGNCSPVAMNLNVLWFNTDSFDELERLFRESGEAIWDNQRPTPGIYREIPWNKKLKFVIELAELIQLPTDSWDISDNNDSFLSNLVNSYTALAWLEIPPWGFHGQSFNLRDYAEKVKVKEFRPIEPEGK